MRYRRRPLLALLGAAAITFEVMRLSRAATDRMFVAEAKGEGTLVRKSVFAVVALCALMSLGIVYIANIVYSHNIHGHCTIGYVPRLSSHGERPYYRNRRARVSRSAHACY